MYMANARNLRLGPNATYIPLPRVGGFALGDAKNLRHPTQKIPTCWYMLETSENTCDGFRPRSNMSNISFAMGMFSYKNWSKMLTGSDTAISYHDTTLAVEEAYCLVCAL